MSTTAQPYDLWTRVRVRQDDLPPYESYVFGVYGDHVTNIAETYWVISAHCPKEGIPAERVTRMG
jgi:hypothetical protein